MKNRNNKKAYLVGIKGVAMTALAIYLKEKGCEVEGSDIADKFSTDEILEKNNITVRKGFSPDNIHKHYDFVIGTGAHGGMTNPEMKKAKLLNLPVFMHGKFLGLEMSGFEGISVAGCHGKTTTSAMVTSLLSHCGLKPSYAIGTASINDLGNSGHFDRGKYLVAEADEYMTCPQTDRTPRFLWQKPKWLILTNIDYDHPDAYKNIDEVKTAYLKFTDNVSEDGMILLCRDNLVIRSIMPGIKRKTVTYGFSSQADYVITKLNYGEGVNFFHLTYKNIDLGEFMIRVPGKHNVLNAAAALVLGNLLGLNWPILRNNIKYFTGTKRRFELIYKSNGILLYDDYAHHPSEIKATLQAAKEWFPEKRIILIFQPHTFSRTKALFEFFVRSFKIADISIITDIYPSAREAEDSSISSKLLVTSANKVRNNSIYLPALSNVLSYLESNIDKNDLLITMGAGDIFLSHNSIIKIIKGIK
jgi:UDP-N-acetylmuramate--alanine ligase